jgi:hypothetical protein
MVKRESFLPSQTQCGSSRFSFVLSLARHFPVRRLLMSDQLLLYPWSCWDRTDAFLTNLNSEEISSCGLKLSSW